MEAFVSRNEEDNERRARGRQTSPLIWERDGSNKKYEGGKYKRLTNIQLREAKSACTTYALRVPYPLHLFERCLVLHEEFSKSMFVVFFPSFTDRIKHAQTKTEMSEGERRDATEAAVRGNP